MSEPQENPIGTVLAAVVCVMVLGLLPMPYGFYFFSRLVTCGAAVLFWSISRRRQATGLSYALGAIALLYNPMVPFHLGAKPLWIVADFLTLLVMIQVRGGDDTEGRSAQPAARAPEDGYPSQRVIASSDFRIASNPSANAASEAKQIPELPLELLPDLPPDLDPQGDRDEGPSLPVELLPDLPPDLDSQGDRDEGPSLPVELLPDLPPDLDSQGDRDESPSLPVELLPDLPPDSDQDGPDDNDREPWIA